MSVSSANALAELQSSTVAILARSRGANDDIGAILARDPGRECSAMHYLFEYGLDS